MDSRSFGKNSPFLCFCFQSRYAHCRCAVDGETDCKGWNSYSGRGEMCNSDKNECQYPCSVHWWRDDQKLASNKGQGKAAVHPKWSRWNWGWDENRKNFDPISTSVVIDISFLQGWFRSRVLGEDFFLDMPHEQARIIRSQTAPIAIPPVCR